MRFERFIALTIFAFLPSASAETVAISSTYLGDGARNYYGDLAPSALKLHWKIPLGSGKTSIAGKSITWSGSGWTGQPLVIRENGQIILIHGALDHHLRKIRASDGAVIWQADLGDAIKGTPTFVDIGGDDPETRHILICGCRRGEHADFVNDPAYSLRAISYLTGRELWRLNSIHSHSNSRDVDGSALMIGNKACVPLENGYFTILSPDPRQASPIDGFPSPKIHKQFRIYQESDLPLYQTELSCESSPTLFNGKAYVAAGCGRILAISPSWPTTGWTFDTGGDLNGSMPVTHDNCLLVGIEKQFIPGHGGVMKIKPGGGVQWFLPTEDASFYEWRGGLVGSPAVNHRTAKTLPADLACFAGVDGHLVLINHRKLEPGVSHASPMKDITYPAPQVLDRVKLPSGTISTPLFIDDRILIGHDSGLELYQVTTELKLLLLASFSGPMFDSTPVVHDRRIYAPSKDGYLYCLGD
jgi:outer membrane protein assembly factor BamB